MYIYKFKYEPHNKQLIKYEMKCLLENDSIGDTTISNVNINPNRSYHINYKIEIIKKDAKIENIIEHIKQLKLSYAGFKIEFVDVKSDVLEYNLRIDYCRTTADLIGGYGQMKNPVIKFVYTNINGEWYFGKYVANDRSFEKYMLKPHTYSHSMSCELSRTIVNIATGKSNPKLIDPCAGIGTVVIEALDLGFLIEACELNWLVYDKARDNLNYFNMPQVISRMDMHEINKKYDVSILDIPYGLMSKTNSELQFELIEKCFSISDKLILITNEKLINIINQSSWHIKETIEVPKANYKFTRYVHVLIKEEKR